MKKCSACHQVKDLGSFNKDRSRKDGHTHRCGDCNRERQRRYDAANRDEILAKKRQYHEANRDEISERQRQYYEANRDELLEQKRQYYEANPDKVRERKSKWRANQAGSVHQRWTKDESIPGDQCYWCGSHDVKHMDHIMPIALGGPAEPYNEAMTCVSCNTSKKNKHPLVWLASLFEL